MTETTNTAGNRTTPPPAPPAPQGRKLSIPRSTLSDEEKARILAETEQAMREEARKHERLQKIQDASDEFLRIQKEAKQTNLEASEHNEKMSSRRRLMLIFAASLIGLGIILKAIELTVMGGW